MLGISRSKILERWRNRLWKQLAPSWTLTSGVKTRLDSFSDWIVFCDLFVDLEYAAAIRQFMVNREFLEVETPMMQSLAGGAAAKPFTTHRNALDMDLFLRIAPELYLKRLMVGGMERVFEINRNFRNEGISTKHNPEFTAMEVYQAYGDYKSMMELTEDLIRHLAKMINETAIIEWNNHQIDYAAPFRRVTYAELFEQANGFSMNDIEKVREKARKLEIQEAN